MITDTAGPVADTIAGVAWSLFIGSALIFAGVMALLYFALRGRAREVRPALWIIGGGMVFPVVVLSVLLAYTLVRSNALTRAPPRDALVVTVTGKMWWWEVRYRSPAGGPDVVTANEIHIPVGRPILFALASGDVIHSFWVPRLGGKMDMVPGRTNHLQLTATAPGVYRGQCAEYCGEQHARMAMHVVALGAEEFDAWLALQARPAAPPTGAIALRGREAFIDRRCTVCHTVRGVSEEGRLGPDLTHVGSRLHLGAGTLANQPGAPARWIAHVQELKPGARMPSYPSLDAATLHAMGAWLEGLK